MKAFFDYRNAYSDQLQKGYRITDAGPGVANFTARVVVRMATSGLNPVAVFGPTVSGKGVEWSAKALFGADDEIADFAAGLTETRCHA